MIQVTFNTTFVPDANGRLFTFPATITGAILSTSAEMVYVQTSNYTGTWYQIPGFLLSTLDNFRTFIDTNARTVSVTRQSGTGVYSITATRVVIIPANNIITGRKANIDFSNYEEVKAFYGLKD